MKLLLHELHSARALMAADDLGPALKRLARVKHVQKQLVEQWDVLATLTPSEYALIRPFLATSSGFQSHQYRAVEFLLGNKNADMVRVFEHSPVEHDSLQRLLGEPTLYDEFLRYLSRRGYAVPAAVLERDVTQPYRLDADLVEVFAGGLRLAGHPLGGLRDLRGARRHRGPVPAVAVPAPAGGVEDDRAQAGHRRLERGRLPAPGPRPDLLPRALRGARPRRVSRGGDPLVVPVAAAEGWPWLPDSSVDHCPSRCPDRAHPGQWWPVAAADSRNDHCPPLVERATGRGA